MRHIVRGVVAAALGVVALDASALNVDFLGFGHGSQTVSYSLTAPNAVKSGSASAGGFLTSVNRCPSFETYCVGVYQTMNFADPAYPNYTLVTGAAHAFSNPNANLDLGRLYAEGHTVNTAVTEAAFQMAIWEIAYETSGSYDLAHGSAIFSGTSGASTLATSWLAGLGSAASAGVLVLENREHQDVIYAPVPEPETYALMAAGLFAMGFVARRQRPRR